MTVSWSECSSTRERVRESLTVANDVAFHVLGNSEEGRPSGRILKVEIQVIVFRQRIEVGQA